MVKLARNNELLDAHAAGATLIALALKYDMSYQAVYYIVRRERRRRASPLNFLGRDCPTRAINALTKFGITTPEKLHATGFETLLCIPELGMKTVAWLEDWKERNPL